MGVASGYLDGLFSHSFQTRQFVFGVDSMREFVVPSYFPWGFSLISGLGTGELLIEVCIKTDASDEFKILIGGCIGESDSKSGTFTDIDACRPASDTPIKYLFSDEGLSFEVECCLWFKLIHQLLLVSLFQ